MSRPTAWTFAVLAALTACGKPSVRLIDARTQPVPMRLEVDHWQRDVMTKWQPFLALRGDGFRFTVVCQHEFATRLPTGPTPGLLDVEPSGRRVAVRCAPTDDWSVHVLAGESSFAMCPNPAWSGPRVSWPTVASVDQAAVASVHCGKTGFSNAARAVERLEGQAGLGRFLRAMTGPGLAALAVDDTARAEFTRTFERLAPDDRAAVGHALREGVLSGPDLARTSLAGGTIDLDDPAFTPAVLAAALGRCGGATRDPGCDAIFRRYATLDPAGAARVACEQAARVTDYNLGALRVAALAQAGERCEVWAARHEAASCADLVGGRECPSSAGPRPCTAEDYRAEIAAELAVPRRGQFPSDGVGHLRRMVTAAARAMRLSCVTDPLGALGPNAPVADAPDADVATARRPR